MLIAGGIKGEAKRSLEVETVSQFKNKWVAASFIPSCIQKQIGAATRNRRRRTFQYVEEYDEEPTKIYK